MVSAGFYHTSSPILFIVFNRPDTTGKVFAEIRNTKPQKLYIAADGPRPDKPGEQELCEKTRAIIDSIDWPCQIFTLFNAVNKGCKNAVADAITWFFEHEEEGIILEDDCLPHNSFFSYCDEMLARYRYDTRIRHITGSNLQDGTLRGDADYYYSRLTLVWGWAGWRRVWQGYNRELSQYNEAGAKHYLNMVFDEPIISESWLSIFKQLKADQIDTWDYQLVFLNLFNNSLSVIPNKNLISNIGFNADATHTKSANSAYANIPLAVMPADIKHPVYMLPDKDADLFIFNYVFDVAARKRKQNSVKNKVKQIFKSGR